MKNYARIAADGVVIETYLGNPAEAFVKALADEFVEVPDETERGDKQTSDGWIKAVDLLPPLPEPAPKKVWLAQRTLSDFMTRAERIAYKAAAASDPIIEDFAEQLAAGPVVITDAETVEAIDKLKELKVLTAARATELKALEA